jgi:RimJ/RimL family protein N-acetyltransferase
MKRERTEHPDTAEQGARLPASAARTWVPIRSLGSHHRGRVRQHLLALDSDDRAWRFGHHASDERVLHYVEAMDFDGDAIFGVFDRQLRLVAMVHLAFQAQGDAAEFGISVLPSVRGRGVGALLFGHAVTLARNRGVHKLVIHLARDNAPMLAIVRRAGASLAFEGSDAIATLPLACDTLGTQMQELLGQQAAELDYRLKRQALRPDRTHPRSQG